MTILCGLDFTEPALRAARVAALLAARRAEDLALVHILELPGADQLLNRADGAPGPFGKQVEEEIERDRHRLREAAGRLAPLGAQVTTEIIAGVPDEALVAHAQRKHASLIVLSALGRRSPSLWKLGSTADRVCQMSPIPVLVARKSEGLELWLRGEKPATIVVGVDASPTSDAAVRFATELAAVQPARIVGVHVYWPPEHLALLEAAAGKQAQIPIGRGHPEIERTLRRDLGARLASIRGGDKVELVLVGGLGRPADHVVQVADAEHADLAVVGTHQRSGLRRFWHGSVLIARYPSPISRAP